MFTDSTNNDKILKIKCRHCDSEMVIDCSKFPTNIRSLDTINGATITLYAQWTINNYVRLDESLKTNNNIITNVPADNKLDYVYSRINTSGTISIFDRNDNLITDRNNIVKTGDKFKIEFSSTSTEYILSIKGDTNSDGKISIGDVAKLYQYLKKK